MYVSIRINYMYRHTHVCVYVYVKYTFSINVIHIPTEGECIFLKLLAAQFFFYILNFIYVIYVISIYPS